MRKWVSEQKGNQVSRQGSSKFSIRIRHWRYKKIDSGPIGTVTYCRVSTHALHSPTSRVTTRRFIKKRTPCPPFLPRERINFRRVPSAMQHDSGTFYDAEHAPVIFVVEQWNSNQPVSITFSVGSGIFEKLLTLTHNKRDYLDSRKMMGIS